MFVGNVPYDATEASLREIFAECGPVREVRLVVERDTGKLKGYGFVEFDDYATAMSAVRNLGNREYNGRQLRVDHAETMKNGGGSNVIAGAAGGGHEVGVASAVGVLRADVPVGVSAAKVHQGAMRHAFEGAVTSTTGAAMDLLTKRVSDLTPTQLYEIMSQMKQMTESDPAQARTLLVNNPQLSLALFQAQLVLGMVKPPAGAATPLAPHVVGQQAVRTRAVPPPPPVVRTTVVPPPPMAPMAPVRQVAVPPPPVAPVRVAPMAPPAAATAPALDQQQALLRQVLSMTPAQIAILPPDQRAQVEYLRQLAAQQGMVR